VGKIKTSVEADTGLALASDKQKYTASIKPKLVHAETALLLAKLKTQAEKAANNLDEPMYVYGKNGIKITL
jgi:hypothetical protein